MSCRRTRDVLTECDFTDSEIHHEEEEEEGYSQSLTLLTVKHVLRRGGGVLRV